MHDSMTPRHLHQSADSDENVEGEIVNRQSVATSCSSSYAAGQSSSRTCDTGIEDECYGAFRQRLICGSSDTLWSSDTVYSDAVSEKAVRSDEASMSGHDLQTADEVTSDDEFYY
jgi:hypothetical protein